MQSSELKEQLEQPSHKLFVDEGAGVDLAREVGQSIGSHVFGSEDPNQVINGIINMEAYFHHLRTAALQALKRQLTDGYSALAAIEHDAGADIVVLDDGTSLTVPGHTAPALNELLQKLGPAEGYDNPRLCLELIQQASRLMLVMGLPRLLLRNNNV